MYIEVTGSGAKIYDKCDEQNPDYWRAYAA